MLQNLSADSLILGPRPGKKSLDKLAQLELTHCCTLLSEREDPTPIKKICARLNCEWLWLPIEGGKLETLQAVDIVSYVKSVDQAIANMAAPKVYLHCSAGIHRTGFFAYTLLRTSGMSADAARQALAKLRPVTAEQVEDARLKLAEEIVMKQGLAL